MFPNLPTKARALNATLNKMWEEGVQEGPAELGCSDILDICAIEGSDGPENIYLYNGEKRGMYTRGKDGSLVVEATQVYEASVPNVTKYLVIDVPLDEFKDDKIGQYSVVAREHGVRAVSAPIIDVEELFARGDEATALCHDGKPMFATDHPADPSKSGSATWSNKLTKSAGLTFDTFGEVLTAMLKFPSATPGKARGTMPTHLLVTADYFGMAMDICTKQFPSGLAGGENKWLGLKIKPLLVANWSRDIWSLVDARSKKKRPIVLQEREPIQLVPHGIDPSGAMEFERGTLRWVSNGRHGVGYADPSKAVLVIK